MRTVLAALLLASVATACSSDPIDVYFEAVTAALGTMRSESIAATPRAGGVTREGIEGVNAARRAAVAALDSIDPPPEVAPEHRAVLAALTDLADAGDAFLTTHSRLEAEALSEAARGAVEIDAHAERVSLACIALDRRAAELGVEADVRC